MLLHRDMQPSEIEECFAVMSSPGLHMEKFTPLSVRLASTQPELQSGLAMLKELIGEEEFGKYIETLVGMRRDGEVLRIITDKELHRSLLERNFITSLKQAFGVSKVRIISQA